MMRMLKISVILLLFAAAIYNWKLFIPSSSDHRINGFNREKIVEYLALQGYPIESHKIETEDGFLLTVHRVPHGRVKEIISTSSDASVTPKMKPVVFLMHGLMLSSFDWISKGPKSSLALNLADNHYDVWIGNNRGNTYSRNHTHLDPVKDRREFFNYSYHEIGIYDLPAMIDYITQLTGQKKITYIGYSEGVTSFLVMASKKPKYNDKISMLHAYAAVTDMHNVTSLIFNSLAKFPFLFNIFEWINFYEISEETFSPILQFVCKSQLICKKIYKLFGLSEEQMPTMEFLSAISANLPAGIALKQVKHYIQGIRTKTFAPFNRDFPSRKNLNDESYDLTKITSPIIIYYGEKDNLVNTVTLLNDVAKKLPNVKEIYKIPYSNFNHADFIWGKNTELLYKKTLENINLYNNRTNL